MLQVKNNQGKLLKEIEAYFHIAKRDFPKVLKDNYFQEVDGEHGRINEREYRLLPITQWFDETEKFKDSFAVVQVKRTRQLKTKTEQETSYYITSLKDEVKKTAGYIRGHWAIENSQYWVLDVTFREDECQIYADDGAVNLSTIRRKLLNLIKAHPLKDSVTEKCNVHVGTLNLELRYCLVKNQPKHNPTLLMLIIFIFKLTLLKVTE